MPSANVWTRCGCPSGVRHPRAACPALVGFEVKTEWACLPCLTGCELIIVPDSRQPWEDWNRNKYLRLLPGRLITGDSGRAGDADRDDAYARLKDAYGDGRIDLEEYERRLDAAGAAISRTDLRAILADL